MFLYVGKRRCACEVGGICVHGSGCARVRNHGVEVGGLGRDRGCCCSERVFKRHIADNGDERAVFLHMLGRVSEVGRNIRLLPQLSGEMLPVDQG